MRAGYSRLEGEEAAERSASSSSSCPTWIRAVSIILLASAVACGLIIPIAILFSGASTLANQMSADRLKVHLTRLQNVAENNQGSRAPWTGYNASVDYVEKELRDNTNLQLSRLPFPFSAFYESAPAQLIQVSPDALKFSASVFQVAYNSGSGSVTNQKVVFVGSGCNASDFLAFPAGSVALTFASGCYFSEKARLVGQAGGAALLVASNSESPIHMTLGSTPGTIPVLSVTNSVSAGFRLGGASVSLTVSGVFSTFVSDNLCAETPGGNPASTIVVGAHLDGVEFGAGINDNGSGSAAVLELAIAVSKQSFPNRIRFCWWGAEELGLLGSNAYVDGLSKEQKNDIKLYLNFDMLGSRNFISFMFDGRSAPEATRNHSIAISNLFSSLFMQEGKPFALEGEKEFADSLEDANTDYGPFLFAGIPCGGLHSGAAEIKTMAERSLFGGFANTETDSCYHRKCDTVLNIDFGELLSNARLAAGALSTLAGQSNLDAYLQSNSVVAGVAKAVSSSFGVAQTRCLPSVVSDEPVCETFIRTTRKPRWVRQERAL